METIGVLAAVAGVLLTLGLFMYPRWKNHIPPHVAVAVGVSLDRTEFPTDRYSAGWGRSRDSRYTVIRIKNGRGVPLTTAGVKVELDGVDHPVWLQTTNDNRELEPGESTYAYFVIAKYGSAVPTQITIFWIGGQKAYRSFPPLEGWT